MNSFKEMDQQAIRDLLDATNEKGEKLYPDVLTPLVRQEEELFSRSPCPKCGTGGVPVVDARRPFGPGSPLPRRVLRCVVCQTEYDPKTGLITSARLIDESA